MGALPSDIADLLDVVGPARDEADQMTSALRVLEGCQPSLLLLADADGEVITVDDLQSETSPQLVESLAGRFAEYLAGRQECRLQIPTERGRRMAFAVRLFDGSGGEILGCLMPPCPSCDELPDDVSAVQLVCAAIAWTFVHHRVHETKLRTRIQHLLTEHHMLKASHAEATAAAIEEREERLREQQHQAALEELCQATEAANRAKSQFLANMSHELRTPLHGVLSFATFGVKKAATGSREDLARYFQKVEHSGKILLNLVNDLLDLAKLESGKMVFEFSQLDLHTLIRGVADEFSSTVSGRKIVIEHARPDFDASVIADQDKLMQVVRNLLSNAIKFSPDGSRIDIRMQRKDKSIVVSVHDQGMGIPEDELEAIFDKFIQSSKTRTGAGGTGLGLSICKEIINTHRGRIWAENWPEGGAVLSFEIPLNLHDVEPTDARPQPEAPPATDPQRIANQDPPGDASPPGDTRGSRTE